jgi:four helix bundle protein
MMAKYRELIVWQRAMNLVVLVYRKLELFPKNELYALTDQIRRCSVSVPSNIAEGAGRNSKKEFVQFLHVALGSLYELQTQLEIAERIGYLDNDNVFVDKIFEIEKMLNSLISSMKRANQ